jgi:hypothetical protein
MIFFVVLLLISFFHNIFAERELITKPGAYLIGLDLTHNPTSSNDSVVIIDSNEVILDLGGNKVLQVSGNAQSGINGIEIKSNRSNIVICNGVIESLTGSGIIVNQGCSHIAVKNMVIQNCQGRAVSIEGISGNVVRDMTLNSLNMLRCAQSITESDAIINCVFVDSLKMIDCQLRLSGNPSRMLNAIQLNNCTTSRFNDISILENEGSTQFTGFQLDGVENCMFSNCLIGRNCILSSAGNCIGFDFLDSESSNENLFLHCMVFANTATIMDDQFFGFRVGQGNNDNSFSDCRVSNNASNGDITGYLNRLNNRNTFLRCLARRNTCDGATAVSRGFFLDQCTSAKIVQSLANDHLSTQSSAIGVDLSSSSESNIEGTLSFGNSGVDDASSFGIREATGTDNIFSRNLAQGNGGNSSNQLSGLPANSVNAITSANVNNVKDPWSNVGIIG